MSIVDIGAFETAGGACSADFNDDADVNIVDAYVPVGLADQDLFAMFDALNTLAGGCQSGKLSP